MSRPQGWSSLRNSRLHHVGADRPLAENARFPPLAEMLTASPCQGVAEKVSLDPFACSESEGADYSRPALQANGTRPRKRRPSITSRADSFAPIGAKIRKATGLEASGPFLSGAKWRTCMAPFLRKRWPPATPRD